MLTAVKNQTRVLLLSVKYNIMREMINRVTFLMNVLFMILNNATFILQWVILFQIREDIGGYEFHEVLTLWGVAASTFGLSHIFFHRVYELSDLIMYGKLDAFLVQPKNVLLGVISSGTSPSAIGDLLYGYLVLALFNFSWINLLLFTIMTILGAIIMTAFAVIVGSLSFWIVRGDMIAHNLNSAVISISTYPDGIFKNSVRLILYTLVPVGLINYLPLKVILHFHPLLLLIVLGVTVVMVLLAFAIFYRGLKRYSSSSLMIARI